jgi:NADH:ubiquinone oxidoreductase subunit H
LFYVLLKTMVVMICVRLAARVTPQIRADQITDFSLKVLSPFGLVALAGAAVLAGLGAII